MDYRPSTAEKLERGSPGAQCRQHSNRHTATRAAHGHPLPPPSSSFPLRVCGRISHSFLSRNFMTQCLLPQGALCTTAGTLISTYHSERTLRPQVRRVCLPPGAAGLTDPRKHLHHNAPRSPSLRESIRTLSLDAQDQHHRAPITSPTLPHSTLGDPS